jgi:hypothetical protein
MTQAEPKVKAQVQFEHMLAHSSNTNDDEAALEVKSKRLAYNDQARAKFPQYDSKDIEGCNSTTVRCALDTLKDNISLVATVDCRFFKVSLKVQFPGHSIYECRWSEQERAEDAFGFADASCIMHISSY